MIAAHHTMLNKSASKDVAWDYNTIFSLRKQFTQELSPVGCMPTLLATYTLTKFVNYNIIILSIKPGWLGFLGRYASTDQILHYWLFDTENNTWEDTQMSIDLGSNTYTGGMVINRAGKVVFLNRYLGKVWTFEQDGSNLQYIGQTNTSFSTSFGVRLYANYDGKCIAFGEDTTNGKRYVIDEDFNITQPGTISNTHPYNYIQLPGKVVVTGSTGIMSIYNEDMTSTLVSNRGVSSYISLNDALYISPFTENLVMYGMQVKNTKLGVNVFTNADFTSSVTNQYPEGNIGGAYLPTGEYIWRHGYHSSYTSQPICNRIYNQSTDTITDVEIISGTTEPNVGWRALPTGKYFTRYATNGIIYFKLYDFGFNKKYFPPALCISPFGYNGGRKIM